VVALIAATAGILAPPRFLRPPRDDAPSEQRIAWWACRALVFAAVMILALRMYLLIDTIVDMSGDYVEGFYGATEGEAIVQVLPDVLFEPGVLLALAAGLYVLSQRAPGATRVN
jgi:hypothetical protein